MVSFTITEKGYSVVPADLERGMAPQRIATDTSQKLGIRFGETIKAYQARGLNMPRGNTSVLSKKSAGNNRFPLISC